MTPRDGLLGLSIAIAAIACGRGIVPGATYEQPLVSLRGAIRPSGGLGQAVHPIVSVLWTDPLQRHPDLIMPSRWLRSTVDTAADTFTLDIFRPPPLAAVVDLADTSGAVSRLGFGELVLVDDPDGDGEFRVRGPRATIDAPEHYLGGSANVLTYVAQPVPAPANASPLTLPSQSGYAVVNYVCDGQVSGGTQPIQLGQVDMVVQSSHDFPDVRTCRASHGP